MRPRAGREALVYFLLTFAVTEPCFIAAARLSHALPPGAGFGFGINALILLGTFAPALVALALTATASGRQAVQALLMRLFRWQVPARWYVFAFTYMVVIKLGAALLLRLSTGAWPRFGGTPWYLMLAATLISTLVGGQSGEELGWRGYALPRLSQRFGLAGASVLLGMIWACWHLPLFFLSGADKNGQSFPLYFMQVTALSVAVAWLYWRTHGSLLLTMLMHAAVNNTKDIIPSTVTGASSVFALSSSRFAWFVVALLWLAAGCFLVRMRGVGGARAAAGDDFAGPTSWC